ncbi:MAG: hypothetical protein ACYDEE_10990 [Ignavibacteriaceae bacterium]
MKNYDARIKKMEEILLPKKNLIVLIDYLTSEPESYFEVKGNRYSIPPGVNVYEFIKDKLKNHRGIVTATFYLAQDIAKESVPDLSNLATKKDDLLITIKGYDGRI